MTALMGCSGNAASEASTQESLSSSAETSSKESKEADTAESKETEAEESASKENDSNEKASENSSSEASVKDTGANSATSKSGKDTKASTADASVDNAAGSNDSSKMAAAKDLTQKAKDTIASLHAADYQNYSGAALADLETILGTNHTWEETKGCLEDGGDMGLAVWTAADGTTVTAQCSKDAGSDTWTVQFIF